jgi:hypothetical protein
VLIKTQGQLDEGVKKTHQFHEQGILGFLSYYSQTTTQTPLLLPTETAALHPFLPHPISPNPKQKPHGTRIYSQNLFLPVYP